MAAAQMSVSQLASRTAIASRPAVSAKPAVAVRPSKLAVVCEAESKVELTSRRAALSIAAAGAALVAQSNKPALAAYGQTANVFGSTTNTSGTSVDHAEIVLLDIVVRELTHWSVVRVSNSPRGSYILLPPVSVCNACRTVRSLDSGAPFCVRISTAHL